MVHHMDVGGGSRCLVPVGSLMPKQWGENPSYGKFKGNRFKTMACGGNPEQLCRKGAWRMALEVLESAKLHFASILNECQPLITHVIGHEWASGGPPKKVIFCY